MILQSRSVSVVIPLYNKAAHVRRALESVFAQTFEDFELIVVDDGSTDGGGELVRAYDDPRVRVVVQENAGVSAARNRGIAEAGAQWIAFLDADDAWKPRFLERTLTAITAHNHVDVVFTNFVRTERRHSIFPTSHPEGYVDDYLDFYVMHNGRGVNASAVLVRKSVLERVGAFPVGIRHGEDIDCWTRLALGGAQFYCVPEILATYHTEATNRAMNADPREFCNSHEPILASCKRFMEAGRVPDHLVASVDRFVQFMLLRHARMLVALGLNAEARRVLRSQCRPSLCGWNRYVRGYLLASTPLKLLNVARAARRLLRG